MIKPKKGRFFSKERIVENAGAGRTVRSEAKLDQGGNLSCPKMNQNLCAGTGTGRELVGRVGLHYSVNV